jgi:hypothetical protein
VSDAKIVITAQDRTAAAFASLRGNVRAAEASVSGLNAAFGGIARIAGPAFAGITFTSFVKSAIDGLDALNDLKDATGASIENLSALEDIAARTGTSFDTVTQALIQFNKVLGDPSLEQKNIIKALGLDLEELRRLDPAEAFRRTAVAINSFSESGDRQRSVQILLKKNLSEIAPLLKDVAEGGELVAKVTTQEAEAAEAFNKEVFKLQKNVADLARSLASELLPAINGIFSNSREGGLAKVLGLEDFGSLAKQAVAAYRLVGLARERITPLSILDKDPTNAGALAELARIDAKAKEIAESFKNARTDYLKIGESKAGAGRGFINPPLIKPDLNVGVGGGKKEPKEKPETIDQSTKALESYVEALRERVEVTAEATEFERALYAVNKSGALATDRALAEQALSLASLLDQRKAITKESEDATKADEEQARALRAIDAQLEEFSGRTVEAMRQAQIARLQARQAAGEVFSPEELRRIYAGIYGLREATEDTVEQADNVLRKFSENVQDAFGDTVLATLEGNYSNILKLWGNLIKRLVAEAIAADLTRALFGDLAKGKGNNTSELLGALFKAVGGAFGGGGGSGYPDDLPTRGGRAGGGRVDAGRLYEVNEGAGPGELFRTGGRDYLLPANDGVIIPNGERGAGGAATQAGAVTVQIVNNGRPLEVQQTSQESTSVGTLIKVVTRELARDFATGGAVAKAASATFGLQRVAGAPRRG